MLAAELRRGGHAVRNQAVSELLHVLGYSLQADRKTLEGTSHPDRDAQFRHIDGAVQLQQPPWAWPPRARPRQRPWPM